jgi:ligand-binding sensor domain-containing protein
VVGVGGRRLFQLDAGGQTRTLYEADAELIGLQAAARGGYWALTQDALLRVQDGKVAERMPAPQNRRLRWFHEDTRGRLYAYAEGELERRFYRWQGGEWQLVPVKDNRGRYYDDLWLCAVSDAIGHLWIGARTG